MYASDSRIYTLCVGKIRITRKTEDSGVYACFVCFWKGGDIETNINLTCNILPISYDPMNVYIVVPSYQARHLS